MTTSARIASLVLLALAAAGCKPKVARDALLGHWSTTEGQLVCNQRLNADATFTGSCISTHVPAWTMSGTWALNGTQLVTTTNESTQESVPAGKIDSGEVVSVSATSLVLRSEDCRTTTYAKVTP